jgi:hypothetical protein
LTGRLIALFSAFTSLGLAALIICLALLSRSALLLRSTLGIAALLLALGGGGTSLALSTVRHILGGRQCHSDQHGSGSSQ